MSISSSSSGHAGTVAASRRTWGFEYLGLAALMLLAVGLRVPYVGLVPRFTDETDVVVGALGIARGEHLPLTGTDAYIGAGFSYVVALLLTVLGPDPVLPRYVVLGSGVLTVGAAFLLGRELAAGAGGASGTGGAGRAATTRAAPSAGVSGAASALGGAGTAAPLVGLVAAALVATSPVHILVNSRIAWSHATTPLFTTLGLWLLARAVRRAHGPSLALAGLCLGVALQTHPTVVALLPGCAWWLLRRPHAGQTDGRQSGARLGRRWLALAVLLGVLGAANLVAYNVLTGFDSVRAALDKADAYDVERGEATGYVESLGLELGGLARLLAGAVGQRRGAVVPLVRPDVLLWAALVPLALAYAAKRGTSAPGMWLVPAVVVPYLLIVPLLNAKYEPLLNGRYLMPVALLIWVACADALVSCWRRGRGPLGRLAAGLALIVMLGPPLASLADFTREAIEDGGNGPYLALADRVRRAHRPGELVLIDAELGGARVASNRRGVGVLDYLLTVDRDPLPLLVGDEGELALMLTTGRTDVLLVLLPDAHRRLRADHELVPVGPAPPSRQQRIQNAGLFRPRG